MKDTLLAYGFLAFAAIASVALLAFAFYNAAHLS